MKRMRNDVKVLDFIQSEIQELKMLNRHGLAMTYQYTLNSFNKFLHAVCKTKMTFDEMDCLLMRKYEAWLWRRRAQPNTSSFYMRNLRALYNKAVHREITEQKHPFKEVYTGIARTKKRAVSEEIFKKLYRLPLSRRPSLELARDAFLFCFICRGMSFVDLTHLRRCDVYDGYIHYSRQKTRQMLSVKIESVMQRIIERYNDRPISNWKSQSYRKGYVFPFLTSTEPAEAYREHRSALRYYNKKLKELSRLLGNGINLTSYVSRHSWATAAHRQHVPISVISQAMGHGSERITQIYLDNLSETAIDNANKDIINILFG